MLHILHILKVNAKPEGLTVKQIMSDSNTVKKEKIQLDKWCNSFMDTSAPKCHITFLDGPCQN